MSQLHHDAELWYAVYCQPLKEWVAGTWLASQLGVKVYVPEIKYLVDGQAQFKPFFPRYLFIQTNLQRVATARINATYGVQSLVTFGGAPALLAPAVIDALRERLDQLNQQIGQSDNSVQPGSRVRLKAGPLQGLEAVFIDAMSPGERVRVLIEFMGRQQVLEVDSASIEPPGVAGAPRTRRTRGHGRPIRHTRPTIEPGA